MRQSNQTFAKSENVFLVVLKFGPLNVECWHKVIPFLLSDEIHERTLARIGSGLQCCLKSGAGLSQFYCSSSKVRRLNSISGLLERKRLARKTTGSAVHTIDAGA